MNSYISAYVISAKKWSTGLQVCVWVCPQRVCVSLSGIGVQFSNIWQCLPSFTTGRRHDMTIRFIFKHRKLGYNHLMFHDTADRPWQASNQQNQRQVYQSHSLSSLLDIVRFAHKLHVFKLNRTSFASFWTFWYDKNIHLLDRWR
jgi:hypothetical protein